MRPFLLIFVIFILALTGACAAEPETLTLPHASAPVSSIAFVTERNGNRDIYLIQPDGTGLIPLIVSPKADSDPAFSPDGTMLAFRSRRDGSSDIYIAAADGSGEWLNLVNDPSDSADDEFSPAWHPSGNLLALYTDRFQPPIGSCTGIRGVHHLGFIALDVSKPRIQHFDDFPGEQETLAWSPDGNTLLFGSVCGGDYLQLYLWDRATRTVTPLTEPNYNAFSPAYSPDGKWLAFSSDQDGSPNLFLINLETGETQNLTKNEFTDSYPAWSPDSQWIAFTRNLGGNEEIFLISVNGGEAINLTNSPGADLYATWSPVLP
ncbi:MAG TPA: DPP IV N-terminal domain-containing protein [Anaerolineales bacterium]|nr:DPP IV N-terminal domain-containing protein [Anaerolineales bacterium]